MQVYLVGGAVRDQLLGLTPTERDWVVVGSSPETMLAQGYTQVGKDFPVFLHPETKEEYALARTERKTGKGYTGFQVHADPEVTLEQDLKRRDLTINAIAQDAKGNIIDPYGGQEDLAAGKLQAVSDSFVEDPVRVLRIARFAAKFGKWGFRVGHKTQRLLTQMVADGMLADLVAERVWQETLKALHTDRPERFFEVLRACGALVEVFPEVDRLFGVPQPKKHHPEIDTGVHTMMVLQQAAKLSEKPEVRFAALVHDLGKGTTTAEMLPRHHGHEARSVGLVKALCARLKVPNAMRDLAVLVAQYHGHFHRVADELTPKTIVKVLERVDAFRKPERFDDFLLACEADQRGRPGYETQDFAQRNFFKMVYQQAQTITAQPFVAEGLHGAAIAEALTGARTKVVAACVAKLRADMPNN